MIVVIIVVIAVVIAVITVTIAEVKKSSMKLFIKNHLDKRNMFNCLTTENTYQKVALYF